jgi:hypothetical protein
MRNGPRGAEGGALELRREAGQGVVVRLMTSSASAPLATQLARATWYRHASRGGRPDDAVWLHQQLYAFRNPAARALSSVQNHRFGVLVTR